ncbi:MAG: hypothetical protein KGH58_03575 [Candidatus Micrarchaeota archaeon]|nr:hypothetical protein [Candidatus Micrarchaeota archaeon]
MELLKSSGIVTSARRGSSGEPDTYTLINEHSSITLGSNLELSLMESVDVQYDEGFRINGVESNGIAEAASYEKALGSLMKKIRTRENAEAIEFGPIEVKENDRLRSALADAAESLLRSYITGAPLIVRFHNDGDGSTGALSLYRALSKVDSAIFAGGRQSSWIMNKSIAYTMDSAYSDTAQLSQHSSVERPVLLITDFGTSEESKLGIGLIKERANVIWIDHHLPYGGFDRDGARYINSWDFGSDSNMTAGALTSFFSQTISGDRYADLIGASFISDYSSHADLGDANAVRLATVLDYMTAKHKNGLTPRQIEAVISDNEKIATTFATATEQMEDALVLGVNSANKYLTDRKTQVFVVDFSPIAEKEQGFPLPGRYSSRLQARLEELNGENVITVVHFGSFISMRVSKAVSAEVDILGVIERLKVSDAEIGGGGHAQAASIRVQKTNLKDALRLLLAELGAL